MTGSVWNAKNRESRKRVKARSTSRRSGEQRRNDLAGGRLRVVLTEAVRVGLVAGATRGAGRAIAVELARAGAYVYATGRSSRETGPSDMDRPETIEETGDFMENAGGEGAALRVDHLEPDQVAGLVARIDKEQGRLDVLVNDIFGGDRYAQWDKKLWEHDLDGGLQMLRHGRPHAPDHV